MRSKMKRGWREGRCGNGNNPTATVEMVQWFPEFVDEYGIQSAADVGAGDLQWFPRDAVPTYHAFDLIPRHAAVKEFNCVDTVLPQAYDVIVCRWVLNHISPVFAKRALQRFVESGSKYLIMSMFDPQGEYWTKHGMYPREGLIREYPDGGGEKGKRMELYRL
jgi:hypothetical protein